MSKTSYCPTENALSSIHYLEYLKLYSFNIITRLEGMVRLKYVEVDIYPKIIPLSFFEDCYRLENIQELIKEANDIGKFVFKGCLQLKDIELPECLTHIQCEAFAKCKNLEQVTFKSQTTEIYTGSVSFKDKNINIKQRLLYGTTNCKLITKKGIY